MRKFIRILFYLFAAFIIVIIGHLFYLNSLSAKETYPDDSFLSLVQNKTALIITAHDDDAVSSSGTMTMLAEKGWKIRDMCFFQQGGLYNAKDSIKNPVRKQSLAKVAMIQGLEGVDPVDFNFRNDMTTEQSYMPMPYDSFARNYKLDSLYILVGNYINTHKPSVIFTLDDVIGGYGHPDHVMMSQLVVKYCREHRSDPGFSVQKIYQSVFSPSLAKNIMKDMPVYAKAKEVYHCDGMPLPDVQVNITPWAKQKKAAMTAYTTEQNSLRKIWPYYNWYPSWIYFRIFDRDFFRVLDVQKL